MSETLVLAFLALSLLAYTLGGGADFGVGILELFAPKASTSHVRKIGEHAIAPVWEANHVWLIVAIVILFVGYPEVHVRLVTLLHVPLLIMLAGIVIRGTAFTFRYYDVGEDRPADKVWTLLFCSGSVIVPLMFGHLVASFSRGRLNESSATVFEKYYAPWIGLFPLAVGVFTVVLFAWLAAVFLVGEVSKQHGRDRAPKQDTALSLFNDNRRQAIGRARVCTVLLIVMSALVALAAWLEGVPWFMRALAHPFGYACVALVAACCGILWPLLSRHSLWLPRIVAGIIVTSIVAGYWGVSYPVAMSLQSGALRWEEARADSATLDALALTLSLGSLVILPSLVWLYRLFKSASAEGKLAE